MWQRRQPLNQLHAVHARHQQVGEHQVKRLFLQPLKRFIAVAGGFDTNVAQVAEQVEQVFMLERMILHNQNAIRHETFSRFAQGR